MSGIQPLGLATRPDPSARAAERGGAFDAAFRQALTGGLRLSAHAAERLRQTGRALSPQEVQSAEAAVAAAGAKGSRGMTLVLLGSLALVVSVPNRTVVTAVDGARMGQGVFTGIDSAVIARGPDPAVAVPAVAADGSDRIGRYGEAPGGRRPTEAARSAPAPIGRGVKEDAQG